MFVTLFSDPYKLCLLVVLLHVIADFNIQIGGRLHDFKCRQWWINQCLNQHEMTYDVACSKYGKDYLVGLLFHSLSWSVVTFLPLIVQASCRGWEALAIVVSNAAFHWYVDDMKANRHRFNLIVDQALHAVQIAVTLAAYMLFV